MQAFNAIVACAPGEPDTTGKMIKWLNADLFLGNVAFFLFSFKVALVVSFAALIPPASVQARFSQSVSELQLLGFVRTTRRKTDHMQRMTWGLI